MVQVTPVRRTLASSLESKCTSCRQQGHAGSKILLQQDPPVLNWMCQQTQVVLCNGCKMLVGSCSVTEPLGLSGTGLYKPSGHPVGCSVAQMGIQLKIPL